MSSPAPTTPQKPLKVCIIGGGVAGLSLADKLFDDTSDGATTNKYTVVEASRQPGGRVRSVYDEVCVDGGYKATKTLMYEAGPWRIPSNHTRAIAFFLKYGATLVQGSSRPTPPPKTKQDQSSSQTPTTSSLTSWQSTCLDRGASEADREDLLTGYAGQTHSAYMPYHTNAPGYVQAVEGFEEILKRVHERTSTRIKFHFNTRVINLRRNESNTAYEVHCCRRTEGNVFDTMVMESDIVFVCVPPGIWKDWDLLHTFARSVSSSVEAGTLHHIYVDTGTRMPPTGLHVFNNDLGQSVASQYHWSPWWQISYSSGRIAHMWNSLALADPPRFILRMRKEIARVLGLRHVYRDELLIKRHFWPVAYHSWKAVPGFQLDHAVGQSIELNPFCLPGVFCAGEAFSSFQAWMEGAIQTAEKAYDRYKMYIRNGELFHVENSHSSMSMSSTTTTTITTPIHLQTTTATSPIREVVFVEGRPIDITKFKFVHPGTPQALTGHIGESIDNLLDHIGHSTNAWAIIHSLK